MADPTISPSPKSTPGSKRPIGSGGTWLIDLDGVVWLAEKPIKGSGDAIRRLRENGVRVVFATNNAGPTRKELTDRLGRAGIEVDTKDVVTSGQAAARLVNPGERVFVCAGFGMVEALFERGALVVDDGPADAVVVGLTHEFDFDLLARTMEIVRAGARLIGTNEDPTHPTPDRLLPGSGAIVSAVETASQVMAEMAGKPHQAMADLVRERYPDVVFVVGDRPATDGLFARRLGVPFGLALSGVTPADHGPLDMEVDLEAPDLAALVDMVFDQTDSSDAMSRNASQR
jgi:HAD superfamily hydrolase (TIGR01450 family)